jgi:dihydroneopterin aldolase/2-amino-4-hydroxy-6-hydroxymethyldihydropteridine diphosphokinase/dihydropteroate synthase
MLNDSVFIKNLASIAITGKDAWNRPTPQPINISVSLQTDFHQASLTDNLKYSLNYAVISRHIDEFMKSNEHTNFKSLGNICESVSQVVLDEKSGGGHTAKVTVESKKSEIRADSIEYIVHRSNLEKNCVEIGPDQVKIHHLRLLTIIGVFTFERLQRQIVDLDISMDVKNPNISIHKIIDSIVLYVEASNFKTVEALVMKIGQLVFQNHGDDVSKIHVNVTKPNAISYTDGVGVSSIMTAESFQNTKPLEFNENDASSSLTQGFNLPISEIESKINTKNEHIAYIAFGSNVGRPVENISRALDLLQSYGIKVLSTSSLYISKPMYYKDQNNFYNGAIKVCFFEKSPHELLKILKQIEYDHILRVKDFDNGPRLIDLDIILYDDIGLNTPDLIIPHKLMLERTFVLQPLCELLPPDFIHPISAEPIHNHLEQLLKAKPNESIQESSNLLQIVPVPRLVDDDKNPLKFDQLNNKHKTLIMGIVNITPDSFSDGGNNNERSSEELEKYMSNLVDDGATILDIGGVSTRPGSKPPSAEEELERVLPIIKLIRSSQHKKLADCLVSIDTYRADVADACLLAGADIINDISMGLYDTKMFEVIAKHGAPYIMNHTRGTTETMSKLTDYESNTNDDIIEYSISPNNGHSELNFGPDVNNLINGISRELSLQIMKAFEQGVRKWQIILDPGIGFAKNLEQNLAIIKHASYFKKYSVLVNKQPETDFKERIRHSYLSFNGLSTLLGPSRKGFLGKITNEPVASKRIVSTAASVVACIEQKTDIVRVHDVKENRLAILTGDAIHRGIY